MKENAIEVYQEHGMTVTIGLDLGSTAIKLAVLSEGKLIHFRHIPTAPGQEQLAMKLVRDVLDEQGIPFEAIASIGATGYGKGLVTSAGHVVDEITANAKGMQVLSGGVCNVIINIGGQDVKIIYLQRSGQIANFRMNDKCAAGTGRFFEVVARIVDVPVAEFGMLSQNTAAVAELSSTCAVFAESEVVSLLAKGTPKESIIKGVHYSVARRIANLFGRSSVTATVYLDGGPAQNHGLREALEDELLIDIHVLPQPQFTVAFGAALVAAEEAGVL